MVQRLSNYASMGEEDGLISVVLNNLLKNQQEMLSKMATKSDIADMRAAFSIITANHEGRIAELERFQLPAWFWPTLGSISVIVGSITAIVELFLTHANTVQNAASSAASSAAALLKSTGHN